MTTSLALTHKYQLGGNVWVFVFRPEPAFTWIAGQFVRIELSHPEPDAAGTKRQFTITSASAEGEVQIATRLTSSTFKQALAALPTGGRLHLLDPPAGDFVWPTEPHPPLVFVAQGIGITPVISNLRQRRLTSQVLNTTIIHANLTMPAPFANELANIDREYPELTYHTTSHAPTPAYLAKLIPNLKNTLIYASGPKSLIGLLAPPFDLPPSRLKQDQFTGYAAADY